MNIGKFGNAILYGHIRTLADILHGRQFKMLEQTFYPFCVDRRLLLARGKKYQLDFIIGKSGLVFNVS